MRKTMNEQLIAHGLNFFLPLNILDFIFFVKITKQTAFPPPTSPLNKVTLLFPSNSPSKSWGPVKPPNKTKRNLTNTWVQNNLLMSEKLYPLYPRYWNKLKGKEGQKDKRQKHNNM